MPRTIELFDGSTSATGAELWETDGTAAGTGLVADLVSGPVGSGPGEISGFVPTGTGAVVFTANDGGTGGTELFVSNGTAAGTGELNNGFVSVPDGFFSRFGGAEYIGSLADLTAVGKGRVLFAGTGSPASLQLWTTDGTRAGTYPVKDFGTSSGGVPAYRMGPRAITALGNGTAVFSAGFDAQAGLWFTDGTAANTVRLGTGTPLVALGGGKALTTTLDGGSGVVLGVTDGTAGGTAVLRDFAGGIPASTAIGGGRALLEAKDGLAGSELWVSDGTAAGTTELVQGPAPGPNDFSGFFPHDFTPLGDGRVLFAANDGNSGSALWVTDGTAAGTALVVDFAPPLNTKYFITGIFSLSRGKALVEVEDYATGVSALVVTNGTAAGTAELQGFVPYQSNFSSLGLPAVLPNGRAVFGVALPSAGAPNVQLWSTDGTAAGTAEIEDVGPMGLPGFTVLPNGHALFTLGNGDGTSTVWSTGGTAASTRPIAGVTQFGSFSVTTVADVDPLFDSDYYYARNPDVVASGLSAYQHFLATGGAEGRSPDPFFDSHYYLAQNPDVAASGINPLVHFEATGWREGRDPSLLFSDSKYLAANPDVAASGMDPLVHYLLYGQSEGRPTFLTGGVEAADPLVNTGFYDGQLGAVLVPTGAGSAQQAAWSYDTSGWQKGLSPDALFETQFYLLHNPDVAAAHINPLMHYEQYGWKEGRDPSAGFSTRGYLAANADVAAAGLDPLLHYVVYGQAEGRAV